MAGTIKTWLGRQLYKAIEPMLQEDPGSIIDGFYPDYEYSSASSILTEELELTFEKMGMASPLVRPNVDIISKSISKVKQDVTVDGEPQADHDLYYILNVMPYPGLGATWYKWYQTTWLMIRGECYSMIVPDQGQDLKHLLPIPADMMEPVAWHDEMGGEPRLIGYYNYYPRGPKYPEKLLHNQVLYTRLPNPFDIIRGLSLLTSFLLQMRLSQEADKWDLDDFDKGLTLNKIISTKPDISPRDFKVAQADFENARKKKDRYYFVRGGDLSSADLQTRRNDNNLSIHSRAQEMSDRVWGIPEGIRDPSATEASARVAMAVFQRNTIQPLLALYDEDINAQVVQQFYPNDKVQVKSPNTVPEDRAQELAEWREHGKVRTVDELRKEQDLEPHPDPDIGGALLSQVVIITKAKYGGAPAQPAPAAAISEEGKATDVGVAVDDIDCPFCEGNIVNHYPGHGTLLNCGTCGKTWDPDVLAWATEGGLNLGVATVATEANGNGSTAS